MTVLFDGADASQPGQPLPAGTKILAAYIGATDLPGPPDTPHIWTRDEWNLYLDPGSELYGGPELRVLPIYVHDFPGDPRADAQNAVDAAMDLGWKRLDRIIAWDSEQLADEPYAKALDAYLWAQGFRLMIYEHDVTQNLITPHGGIWQVLLQRFKPRVLKPPYEGQQWRFGQAWDLDVFSQFVYDNCGRGLRRAVA